jgi:hypothetical protein
MQVFKLVSEFQCVIQFHQECSSRKGEKPHNSANKQNLQKGVVRMGYRANPIDSPFGWKNKSPAAIPPPEKRPFRSHKAQTLMTR